MKVHAIQTGTVRIKTAPVEGRGHGLARRLALFADRHWSDWLPTWAIEHHDGVIVVDTGQGAHLLESGKSLNPYARWEVVFRIEREQEIGPPLQALGIGHRDVKQIVLTHLHMDHDGGLAHFPTSRVLVVARQALNAARGWAGAHPWLSSASMAFLVRPRAARPYPGTGRTILPRARASPRTEP